jgi:ubiquinone/menaquinone biosynthesis C-methylase UbiE
MTEDRRFPPAKLAKLDAPERHQRMPPAKLVELVAAAAPTTLLDVGVGTGYFAIPLAGALPGASIIGLDVEPQMLEVFRERATAAGLGKAITTVQAPPDSIPLADASVDAVLMAAVYHEFDDRRAYLVDTRRVMRSGGLVVIADWHPERGLDAGPPADHRIAPADVEADLLAAEFSAVASHELYESFYVITARS